MWLWSFLIPISWQQYNLPDLNIQNFLFKKAEVISVYCSCTSGLTLRQDPLTLPSLRTPITLSLSQHSPYEACMEHGLSCGHPTSSARLHHQPQLTLSLPLCTSHPAMPLVGSSNFMSLLPFAFQNLFLDTWVLPAITAHHSSLPATPAL